MSLGDRFDRLFEMGCCVCGDQPQIHHLTGVGLSGMALKADDEKTIPLCEDHHTGANGIHRMGVATWEDMFGTQLQMLEWVNMMLGISNGGVACSR